MATATRTTTTTSAPLQASRKAALVMGVLYIATFLTSIPAALLYDPVLHDAHYIVSAGADTRVLCGAFLEVLLIIANIGTALALFSVLRRQHEGLTVGYVAARIMECAFIGVGILSVLSIVTLRQHGVGADAAETASLITVGRALVAVHDWTFLFGPGLCGLWNGLMLGYLLYRSGLMPRRLTLFGLIGGPLVFVSGIAVLFGLYSQTSPVSFFATLPEVVWEASIGIWFVVIGLKTVERVSKPAARASSELVSVG
jgi:hypothetical protein